MSCNRWPSGSTRRYPGGITDQRRSIVSERPPRHRGRKCRRVNRAPELREQPRWVRPRDDAPTYSDAASHAEVRRDRRFEDAFDGRPLRVRGPANRTWRAVPTSVGGCPWTRGDAAGARRHLPPVIAQLPCGYRSGEPTRSALSTDGRHWPMASAARAASEERSPDPDRVALRARTRTSRRRMCTC
jgi:hypothetical protein